MRSRLPDPGDNMPEPSVTGLVSLAVRVLDRTVRRVRPDHASLPGGWYTQNYGNRPYVYLSAACAPARRFRRRRPVRAAHAHAFIEATFDAPFDATPTQSLREVVAFEVPPDPSVANPERAVRVYDNGRVEVFWRVPHELTDDGRIIVSVVDIFAPMYALARGVASGAYKNLYRLRTRARRLDWYAAVSPHISTETGWSEWHDLRFPGARPRIRASRGSPALSPLGLALEQLRSRRQRTPPRSLLRPVLDDLLTNSGWDGNEDAIRDTLAALEAETA